MAIFRKTSIARRLKELDEYYLSLRTALEGRTPNEILASTYGKDKNSFIEDCVQVDFGDVLIKLEHFKVEVTAIKTLKDKILK